MSQIKVIRSIEDIQDKEELVRLMADQLKSYGADADPDRLNKALDNALKKGSRAVLFLWEDHKFRAGAFAFANICSGLESGGDYLWINELFVSEPFRRRGIATEMLKSIDHWVRDNHLVYIACSTGTGNSAAQELYRKEGFDVGTTLWVDKEIK